MRIKTKKKLLLLFILGALFIPLAFATGANNGTHEVYAEAVFPGETLPNRAYLGDEITLPAAEIVIDGQNYPAETLVTSPGGVNTAADTFVTDETGRYTVDFYVIKDGIKYTETKYVTVYSEVFSAGSGLSSLSYGTNENYAYASGLNVSLNIGDSLSYNNAVSMTDKTIDDTLLSFYITPAQKGSVEAANLKITLSDMYNPSNKIVLTTYTIAGNMYLRATVNGGAESKGLETTSYTSDATRPMLINYWNGNNYYIWTNTYGAFMTVPTDGNTECKVTFSMDYAEKRLFVHTSHNDRRILLIDLDDYRVFENGFEGFESGMAFIQIEGADYVTSKFNFVLAEIDGKPVSAEFEKEHYAPVIGVDMQDYSSAPHAVLGKTYPVFAAEVKSEQGNSAELVTSVYYGYATPEKVEIPIENGRFATEFPGTYTIEYKATDSFGREAVMRIDVPCGEYESLSAEVKGFSGEHTVGSLCDVPDITVYSSYGEQNVNVTVRAVLKRDENIVYNVENGQFLPFYSGDYVIEYTCTDFAESIVEEYDYNVLASDVPVFFEKPDLPAYFIAGASYALPEFYGTVFTSEGFESVKADVIVKEDGVAVDNLDEKAYIPGKCSSLEIIYTVENNGESDSYTAYASVADVGYGGELDFTAYFHDRAEGLAAEVTESDGIKLSSAMGALDAEFIRELLASELSVRVGMLSSESNLNVEIRDMLYPEEKILLTYGGSQGTEVYLNGKYAGTVNSLAEGSVTFSYNSSMLEIYYSDTGYTEIDTYINGSPFKGFSSGRVYVRFYTEEAASINVINICGQRFGTLAYDQVRPYYEIQREIEVQSINAEFTIAPTLFSDVLDPSITVNVSVLSPDNEYVTAKDGTLLKNLTSLSKEYVIVLSEYGQYKLSYTVTDSMGNKAQGGYGIRVADEKPPELILSGIIREAKAGEAFALASVTVADNVNVAEDITVFFAVKDYEGVMTRAEGTFMPEKAGVYEVYAYAVDTSGNSVMESYKVIVS